MTIFDLLSVQSMFKYEELIGMMRKYGNLKECDTVDIFINLEYMIDNLQSRRFCDIEKELAVPADIRNIVSDIFAIVSHYRNFFIYNNIYPRVYLYISDMSCDMEYYPEYKVNSNFRNRYRRKCQSELTQETLDTFMKSISIIQTICKYIEDVSFLVAEGIDSSLIPYIISRKHRNKNNHNIVISYDNLDDIYYLSKNTVRIKIKRRLHKRVGITSFSDILYNDYKVKNPQIFITNPLFMSALIACGNKENIRQIENILGYGPATLSKDIKNGMQEGIITPRTNSIDLFKYAIQEKYRDKMVANLKQIDIQYRINNMRESNINLLMDQMINLYDVEGLKEITNSVFTDYQLDLYNLIKKPRFMCKGR